MADTARYVARSNNSDQGTVFTTSASSALNNSGYLTVGWAISFYANPKEGYAFDHWEYGTLESSSIQTSTSSPLKLTMSSRGLQVTAYFAESGTGSSGGSSGSSGGSSGDSDGYAATLSADSELTAQLSGNTVTLTFTGTCACEENDTITYQFYKNDTSIQSGSTLSFPSGQVIGASDNCTQTITLTESELSQSSITFKVVASCSQHSSSSSISVVLNPQSGQLVPVVNSYGSDLLDSGYELWYWDGTEWVPIVAFAT